MTIVNATQVLSGFNVQLPLIGVITDVNWKGRTLNLRTRIGNVFEVNIRAATWRDALKNLNRIKGSN